MAISLVIAFIRGWMLTLICLATFPLMIIAQYFQFQFIAGLGGESNKVPPPKRTHAHTRTHTHTPARIPVFGPRLFARFSVVCFLGTGPVSARGLPTAGWAGGHS